MGHGDMIQHLVNKTRYSPIVSFYRKSTRQIMHHAIKAWCVVSKVGNGLLSCVR